MTKLAYTLTPKQEQELSNAQAVYDKAAEKILSLPNVNSIGIGRVFKDGVPTNEIGLVCGVGAKIEVSALATGDVVPTEFEGVRVDVEEDGELVKEVNLKSRVAGKWKGGYSCGNAKITAGTTGNFSKRNGAYYIDSNAHVLSENPAIDISQGYEEMVRDGMIATEGSGIKAYIVEGDELSTDTHSHTSTQQVVEILQPGRVDGGTNYPVRSNLARMVRINPDGGLNEGVNFVDSARGLLTDPEDWSISVPYIEQYKGYDDSDPQLGELVKKTGRTTGFTKSVVERIHVTARVNYGAFTATFKGLVAFSNFSSGGDSGSTIVLDGGTKDGYMKYRLFAGSSSITLGFRIAYAVEILGGEPLHAGNVGEQPPGSGEKAITVDATLQASENNPDQYIARGHVVEANGDDLEGVMVMVEGEGLERIAHTDEAGNYEITETIAVGNYKFIFSKSGYDKVIHNKTPEDFE